MRRKPLICPHCSKTINRLVSDAKRREIMKLHKAGLSYREIQAATGIGYATAHRIVKDGKGEKAQTK